MPRIDPFQLLKCLSVLLGPTGGIKSKEEVHRLANLMTKFSKKLVSKCIYIQILKTTDTDLLSQFMDAGGWSLIHMWLTDGIVAKNWALIQELLELLLLCPVKIERLKSNNCPKLIKGLSKEVSHQIVRILAGHLVEQWLKIVKGEAAPNSVPAQIIGGLPSDITLNSMGQLEHNYTEANPPNSGDPENASLAINAAPNSDQATSVATIATDAKVAQSSQNPEETTSQSAATRQTAFVATSTASSAPPAVPVCKITIRDGDQVLAKVETEASNINNAFRGNATHETNGTIGSRDDEDESGASSEEHKDDGAVGRLISSEVKQQTAKDAKEATTTTTTTAKSKDEGNLKDAVDGASKSSDKENRDSHKTEEGKTGGSCSNNSSLSGEKKSSGSHHGSSSSRSGNSSSKHSSSSHRSGSSSHKSSSSSSSHRSSSSSSRSSKEKSSRDKDRHSSSSSKHGSSSSSSSSSRHKTERDKEREKEKEKLKKDQAEKDKATLEKVQAQAISSKLGKIPRKKPEDEKNAADSLLRKSSTDSRDSSKENKEKTEGKKATAAPAPAAILEKKQISISIENRKNSQDSARPKTVKTFNSKFRSTGLEEEVKPPLPRSASVKKPSVALPASLEKKTIAKPPIASLKRSSPLRETTAAPSDKRAKLSLEPPVISPTDEKKGAIKLIPPKPKPMVLQESDMFMDALTASTKGKEPRKRKRRTSISKDSSSDAKKSEKSDTEGGHDSPQHPSSPQSADDRSPLTVKPNFKFYQDTLETDEDKEDKSDEPSRAKREDDSCDRVKAEGEDNEDDETSITNVVKNEIAATMAKNEAKQAEDEAESAKAEAESPEAEDTTGDAGDFAKNGRSVSPLPEIRYVDGLRSVLLLQKRKGPKKSLKWKTELESVRYFELDETERVNVTKTFTDMKQMEKQNEREAFQMARKLSTEDLMEEKTRWKPLIPIDLLPALVEPGKDSREKDIQYAREKGILQALYFNRSMIPDSASEPDEERHHAMTDPKIIPLEDLTGNKESEKDFTGVAWPEPKPHLTPPQPPVMQPPGGYHFPGAFGHTPPPMMPPMGPQGPMGAMGPPMGPPGPMGPMGPVNPMNAMGPEMGVPMSGPPGGGGGNVGGGGGGGWRTGDGKVVVPDVAMNPMQQQQQQSMPPNMPGGFPPPGMEGPMVPPGMMGPPPMFNQQEGGFGMMGPEDMGFGGYQGPPGPGMFGPGPNFPGGPPPPRGGGPMHGGNRGRGNGPGWFRGGGGGPMRGGGGGGGGGGWRGGWRGNGKQPPICRQFTKNGFCRVGDKCQYLHPGLNCPPF